MRFNHSLIILLPITLLMLGCSGIEKNIFYVKADANDEGEGTSWKRAFSNLQIALSAAGPNSEIWVAAGVYKPNRVIGENGERNNSFQLKSGVGLYGGFNGTESNRDERDWKANETILSGDLLGDDEGFKNNDENCYHVLIGNGTDSTAILDGFTITGGNANFDIWPDDGGGGISNHNGSPTISNCKFVGNAAFADGGGIRNWGQARALIRNCVFENNTASQEGGGMMNGPDSKPTVVNCLFRKNSAGEDGGGMYNNESFNFDIINCVFSSNYAALTGGGIYNVNGSTPNIINCSFSLNIADKGGGSIANNNGFPKLINCILWNNSSATDSEIHNFNSSKTIVNYSFISGGYEGINNFDKDPLFLDSYLRLSSESSAIDAGDNDAVYDWVKTDFAGNPRIQYRRVDMGAYEYVKNNSGAD